MTDETAPPTMRVVLIIRDREVTVEGENLERLRNSTIAKINSQLKRAGRKARREFLRKDRVMPGQEGNTVTDETVISSKEPDAQESIDKPSFIESLKSLGIKEN